MAVYTVVVYVVGLLCCDVVCEEESVSPDVHASIGDGGVCPVFSISFGDSELSCPGKAFGGRLDQADDSFGGAFVCVEHVVCEDDNALGDFFGAPSDFAGGEGEGEHFAAGIVGGAVEVAFVEDDAVMLAVKIAVAPCWCDALAVG